MSARARFILAAGVMVGSIAGLIVWSLSFSTYYYVTPTELVSGEATTDRTVRVAGNVVEGSILHSGAVTTFALTDGVSQVPVTTRDVLPDTFASGIETVAEGGLGADGVFSASSVLVKCPSKFEAELAAPPA
ncbi:MAG: cytochrome c maturation protein CcmE [Actinomycetota bacterium]